MLPEHLVKEWVSGFGIAVPRGATASCPDDVAKAASELSPPLVVKAYGPDLVHKSDAGAVRLELRTPAEAARAAAGMAAALGDRITGFLVEEQAEPGVEVIVGAVHDPAFGPVILTGLGGVWTEVMRDTAVRLCPITTTDAHAMLSELRGAPLLTGFRGAPPIDRDALVRILLAVGGPGGIAEHLAGSSTRSAGAVAGPPASPPAAKRSADSPVAERLVGSPGAVFEFELNPVICTPSGATAVDARLLGRDDLPRDLEGVEHRRREPDFDRLFAPRGVAVVGASTKRPNFGNMFLGFYQAAGTTNLVAVHPTAGEIDGVPCVPSLAAAEVDYALVAVPAERCPDVIRASGVPFVQVMSGGFRETGAVELEERLVEAARGSRLLGPNCMGVYSPAGGQTFIGGERGAPGRIAMISQSGGMAGEVIKVGERRGLGFSKVATVGNSADVAPAELVRYLDRDAATSVIGLYLEDPGAGLFEALKETTKPVVALVGGRSAQGHRAAVSHTGAMIGDSRVWDALAEQTGIALVAAQDDLIGALDLLDLHAHRTPEGDGVLVVGPSGGASVLAADALDRAGLTLRPLPDTDLKLGAGTILGNPLEIPLGPRGRSELVREVVTTIQRAEPYPDVITHVNVQSFFTYGHSVAALLAYAGQVAALQEELPGTRVTLVTRNSECAPPGVEDEIRAIARAAGVPSYRSMEAAAVAVAAGRRNAMNRAAA